MIRTFGGAISVLGLALLSCAESSSPSEEPVSTATQALTATEQALNFEGLSWSATGATLALDEKRTEGQHALKVVTTAQDFVITSSAIAPPSSVPAFLWIDTYVTSNNAGWYGGINLFASSPSRNASNAPLGYLDFGAIGHDRYERQKLDINGYPRSVIAGAVNDLTITMKGTAPVGSVVYLDRLYIGQNLNAPTVPATAQVAIDLPAGLEMSDVALHASSDLKLGQSSRALGLSTGSYAQLSSIGSADTVLGLDTVTGNIYSVPNVVLRSRATVNGSVLTSGSILPDDNTSSIKGIKAPNVDLSPLNHIQWTVEIPTETLPGYSLEPNDKRDAPIGPGHYGMINLKESSKLTVGPGNYILDELVLNSGSQLHVANSSGAATVIYVLGSPILDGQITTQSATANVLLVVLGATPVAIGTNLGVTVVAPNATVTVGSGKEVRGAIFARSVETKQGAVVYAKPFTRTDCPNPTSSCVTVPGCVSSDADSDGLTDCDEKKDGDFWTDPTKPNGASVKLYAPCHPNGPTNTLLDTPAEIQACLSGPILETATQTGGWNWPAPSTPSSCEPGLGFSRPWTVCRNDWQIYAEAHIRVEQAGRHCFALKGGTTGEAGALLVDGVGPVASLDGAAICVDLSPGVHRVNWIYEKTGTAKQPFAVLYCQGTSDCAPVSPLSQRALRDAFSSSDPLCDTPSKDCSELCPCTAGNGTCASNSQCSTGFVCGAGNGSSYGLPGATNVCWDSGCAIDPVQSQCARFPRACEADSDCALGEVCGKANASRFDNQYAHVCWPASCEIEPEINGCGTLFAPCGKCPCVPNCSAKTCGASLDDGCGGTCTGFCGDGGLGCKQDLECKADSVCEHAKGSLFGGSTTDSVCWPKSCRETPAESRDCGQTGSKCGSTCEVCEAQCGERECGLDPKCGKSCGVCGANQYCNGSGKCESVAPDPIFLTEPKSVIAPSEAGTLAGTFSVTATGQAHYSIPLAVPPGVNGLTPTLSLEYDSDGTPTPYGLGWKLAGTSAIRRCPRTYSQGGAKAISYDDGDQFCLDGVPLVLIGESDGTRSYRTEVESYSRITSFSDTGFSLTVGPDSFRVELPNGRIATYGGSASLGAIGTVTTLSPPEIGAKTTWALSRIEDRFGNVIDYGYRLLGTYSKGGKHQTLPGYPDRLVGNGLAGWEPVLKYVDYGYNRATGVGHNRSIYLEYESLDETSRGSTIRFAWDAGEPRLLAHSLKRVAMSYEGSETRNYRFDYTNDSRWLQLYEIQECYGDNCKKPTQFTYTKPASFNASNVTKVTSPKSAGGALLSPRAIEARLDANGDGLEDFLLNPTADPRNPLKCNNDWAIAIATGHRATPYQFYSFQMPITNCQTVSVVDLDSDGKWEIYGSNAAATYIGDGQFSITEGPRTLPQLVYDDDGDGKPVGTTRPRSMGEPQPILFDTDGDGVLQRVWSRDGGLAVGATYDTATLLLGVTPPSIPRDKIESDNFVRRLKRQEPDCDGNCPWMYEEGDKDAKACWDWYWSSQSEIWFCSERFSYVSAASLDAIKPIEANGDNHLDLIAWQPGLGERLDHTKFISVPDSGFPIIYPGEPTNSPGTDLEIRAFENTGANAFHGTHAPIRIAVWPGDEETQLGIRAFKQSFFYDTDHDGRQELVVALPKGTFVSFPIRPELGQGAPGTYSRIIGRAAPVGDYDEFLVTDIDGNGQPDVLYGDQNWNILFQESSPPDRLYTVEDGLGRLDTVKYKSGMQAPYEAGQPEEGGNFNTSPVRIVPPVVAAHEIKERTALTPVTVQVERFSYSDARIGKYGRGFLGFAQVTRSVETDGVVHLIESSEYDVKTYLATAGSDEAAGGVVRNLFPFAGRLSRRTRSYPSAMTGISGVPEAASIIEVETWKPELGSSAEGRPTVMLEGESLEVTERTATRERTVLLRHRSYDYYLSGAVAGTIEQWWGNNGLVFDETETSYEYDFHGDDLTAIWPTRLPTRIIVTNTKDGEKLTRITGRGYFLNGGLQYEQDESGDATLSKRVEYARNEQGNVLTTTTSSGASTRTNRTIYDTRGEFAESEINALGHQSTTVWYKGQGVIAAHQDSNGLLSQTFIDGFGRTVRTKNAQGAESTTWYLKALPSSAFLAERTKLVETQVTPGAPTTNTYYDPFGRKIGADVITQKTKTHTAVGYDKMGRVAWEVSRPFVGDVVPVANRTEYVRDDLGRVVQASFPNDAAVNGALEVQYSYGSPAEWPNNDTSPEALNQASWVVRRTVLGLGTAETELVDTAGRRLALLDRTGATTALRYGPFGTVREVRDAAGITLETTYDALGRATGTVDPIRGGSSTIYSSGLNEIVTVTSLAGTSVRENDALDRVVKETRPEGVTSWTYDVGPGAVGQLVSVIGPGSELSPAGTTTSFTYNPPAAPAGSKGKLASVTDTIANENFSIGYSYDALGRASAISYPQAAGKAFSTQLSYDVDGNLQAVQDASNAAQPKYYELVSLTPLNEVESERLNGSLLTSYAYYPLNGTLKSTTHALNGAELSRSVLEYTDMGSVKTLGIWENGTPSEHSRTFEYDTADRLTDTYQATPSGGQWTRGPLLQQVQHDLLGNITRKSDVGDYTYGEPGNPYAVTSAGTGSYHYNHLGRQTWRGGTDIPGGSQDIVYASNGQPLKIVAGSLGEVTYAYNGSQERVLRKDSSGTTLYISDLYRRTTDNANPSNRTHVYSVKASGRVVAEITLLEQNQAIVGQAEVRTIRNDHIGSTVLSVRSDGDTLRTHYDAFGRTNDPLVSPTGTGFAGYGNEHAVGLLKMGVRLYDPRLGLVLTPDSIAGTAIGQDGLNPYLYAYSRPTVLRDLTGMSPDFLDKYFSPEVASYMKGFVDAVYPQLPPSIQEGLYNAAVMYGLDDLANNVVAYYNAGNYQLMYGDYPLSWLFQTSQGQQALTNAQNACMGVAQAATVIAGGFGVAGLAGYSTFMGAEIGVPALSSMLSFGVTDAVVATETVAPVAGQFMQSDEITLPGAVQKVSPLVYGPSAGGKLAEFAQRVGGQTLNDLAKPMDLGWGEFSIQTLNSAAAVGRPVYFDLTNMKDIPGVLNGTAYPTAITSMEINYVNAAWTQVFQQVVTFYQNGVPVGAPW